MCSCFKRPQKEEEMSVFFFENGSSLLEELIGSFSGRYKNPIRCFTAKELIIVTDNFTDRVIGGSVYRGFLEQQSILIRKFNDKGISSRAFYGAIRDIAVTSQMSHLKNVLKLKGCCLEFRFPVLVYEYAGTKLLSELLYPDGDKLLPWGSRVKIAKGSANAIAYLHNAFPRTIVYRDLKPSKVIIDRDCNPKLFDFSLSIPLPLGEPKIEDIVLGTCGFADPEYVVTSIVTEKTDVYSFGVLLLVLLTGKEVMCRNDGEERIDIVNYVKYHVDNYQFNCSLDSENIFDKDINQEKQFHSLFNLAMECTKERGEDRPNMINVAKVIYRIESAASKF